MGLTASTALAVLIVKKHCRRQAKITEIDWEVLVDHYQPKDCFIILEVLNVL